MDRLSIVDLVAIFISILALITSYVSIRLQIKSVILTHLSEKAKESNDYLSGLIEGNEIQAISGIFTALITGRQLLELQCNKYRISDRQSLINQFYLQLNTTIRMNLSRDTMSIKYDTLHVDIQKQIIDSIDFFRASKEKYS
ncbi:hypothetical protein [Chitinophaga silvisoli]|uniref:DUF4760 domain-containing protein n=1 Tax=Chitinophaga silvisoli TaxID=2291814 RepID=A0A3E1NYZ3_9BACT|nr:hypothetical protein [Chitinophaga silvisoli]RFM33166.1 hypothetical protein DXN04_19235 [Chitinophaga silvisoli]